MSQIVKLRRSSVSGQKPTNTNLQLGELALNTTDGKVYMSKSGSLGPSIEEIISTNTFNTGSVNISGSINLIGQETITGSFIVTDGVGVINRGIISENSDLVLTSGSNIYVENGGIVSGSEIWGDGSHLINISVSGITGLELNKIVSGSVSASISPNRGLEINTDTTITGSVNISGSLLISGSGFLNNYKILTDLDTGSLDSRLDVLEAYSGSQLVPTSSVSFRTLQTDVYVKNMSGTQINKGTVVRIVGSVGDNPLIGVASFLTEGQSANTLGITTENIPNDSFGLVITEGILVGVNTSGMTAGQLLYLGPNGTFTTSYPVAPNHGVRLGEVLRPQQNQGSIYVRIDNGSELGESHDVYDTTTNSSYGDLLVKSGSVWINSRELNGDYNITGSLTITQNLTVLGSSSLVYVTSSNLAVSASFISVNVFEPAERFGGLKVYDSGSSNATASLAWDSLHNHWVYQNASGSNYSGGMLLAGPRNSGSLGDELGLINGVIPKSVGGDHLDNSIISESGSTITINGNLVADTITGSFDFYGLINKPTLVSGSSQVIYSGLTGIPSNIISGSGQLSEFGLLTTGSNSFNGNQNINGNLSVTGSFVISGSLSLGDSNIGGSRYLFNQTTSSLTWSITHNLEYDYPNVMVYDGSTNKVMIPSDISSIDENTTQITFATPEYGYALVSIGGVSTGEAHRHLHTQSSPTGSWVIDHNIGYKYVTVNVYDNNDEQLIPLKISAVSSNRTQIDFIGATSGNAIITVGGPKLATVSIFNETGSFYNTINNIGITGSLVVTGDVDAANFNTTSDKKIKTNLEKVENALEKIEKINGYTFNWLESYNENQTRQIGMLANEVYDVQPELTTERKILINGNEETILLLDYSKVTALLIEAVKELNEKVIKLENKKRKK